METLNIGASESIKDALKKIDGNGLQTLFVLDSDERFRGTLTDGDLRRIILSGVDLAEPIGERFNSRCSWVRAADEANVNFRDIFAAKRIRVIPVIGEDGKVVKYRTSDEFIAGERKCGLEGTDVVIMAGGKGTRMAPFTDILPKPLVPVGNKTIIEKIMDAFGEYGASRFHLTINYKAELMKAYFAELESPYSFVFLREKEFLGTASSLLLLPEDISQTFIVSNCDILVQADYADLLEFHRRSGAALTVVSSMHHHTIPYGVVRFRDGGKVEAIDEKPEYSMPINTGVYILDKKCLELIEPGKLFHMTHLIEKLLQNGWGVMTYLINEGRYIDIGQWEEYRNALERMR